MHLIHTRLSTIQKICLSALFMALVAILQKVVAINYLAFAPFVRISLGGPALIIFASILLGPVYGMFVGIASDLLGYLVFDASGLPPFLQITAIYAVLGFASYFVFSFVFSIKNRKAIAITEIAVLAIIWAVIVVFTLTRNELTYFGSTYTLNTTSKSLICSISFVIFLSIVLAGIFIKPKDDVIYTSPLHICFASFICDFFVLVLFGSVMKGWAFGWSTFLTILICQSLVMFFNVLVDVVFISTFNRFTKKYFVEA